MSLLKKMRKEAFSDYAKAKKYTQSHQDTVKSHQSEILSNHNSVRARMGKNRKNGIIQYRSQ